MKPIWTSLLVIVGVVVIFTLTGVLLPKQHIVTYSHHFERAPEELWDVITSVRLYPQWKPDTQYVQVLKENDGAPQVWIESDDNGVKTTYAVKNSLEPVSWEIHVTDPEIPPGGNWLFELEPNGNGTDLSITETATVKNPLSRFFDRFLVGYTRGIKSYVNALQNRMDATPAHVE